MIIIKVLFSICCKKKIAIAQNDFKFELNVLEEGGNGMVHVFQSVSIDGTVSDSLCTLKDNHAHKTLHLL